VTCKSLEQSVLNTKPIRDVVDNNKIRTIVADWGTKDPAIGELLDRLQGSRQIPFLAVFPGGSPEKVIRIPGLYSRATLLEKLEAAGSSQLSIAKLNQPSGEQDRLAEVIAPLP